jgi:hypothetical protein
MGSSSKKYMCSMTIDRALLKRADVAAEKLGMSRSQFFQEMVRRGLDEAEGAASLVRDPIVTRAFASALSVPGVMQSLAKALGDELNQKEVQRVLSFMSTAPKSPERRRGA